MKIYVGNLPHAVTDEELRLVFAPYGTVTSAAVVMDQFSDKSRGFGFVEMSQMSEALAAIQALNGQELQGRTLTVNEARPRTDRGERRSGGRRDNQRSW
jgi:RNA recognition motif-containing protein